MATMASRSAQVLSRTACGPSCAASTSRSVLPARLSTASSTARRHQSTSTTSSSSSASTLSSTLAPLLPPLSRATAPPLPSSESSILSLLRARTTPSQGLYVIARLHARDYLLHPKDILTLPGPLREVVDGRSEPIRPGTVLRLDRIKEVGSSEYVLRPKAPSPSMDASILPSSLARTHYARPAPTLPAHIVSCTLTIMEHTKSPLQRTLLKKRRKGYEKTIQQKQGWTRCRVGDIVLGEGQA